MPINVKDIDYSLSELNLAIRYHYEWANRLMTLSILGGEPDREIHDLDSHHHCRFSSWIRQHMSDCSLNHEQIKRLDKQHHEMHDIARELMLSIIDKTVTGALLDRYHESQQTLISSLDKYKEYLFSYRNLHDTLTSLPLRHLLYQEFPLIRSRSERAGNQLYLLITDIDRFKTINDTWGHNAGDDVLRKVSSILKSGIREQDRIYRFGGEEFIMLFEAVDRPQAERIAHRACEHLALSPIAIDAREIVVTVTGGLTQVIAEDSLHVAIGRADKAMYYGKNTGRNRCILALPDEEMVTLG